MNLGGSEIQSDLIAKGLTNLGHDVTYAAVTKSKLYEGIQVPYTLVPLAVTHEASLVGILKHWKPDVVYWRYNKRYFYRSAKIIRKNKIPLVFAISHIDDVTRFASRPRFSKGILGKCKNILSRLMQSTVSCWNYMGFRYVDGVTSLNKDYLKNIHVNHKKSINNAMHFERGDFRWGKPYCLWVANIRAQKRPEKFIELAEIVNERGHNIDFIMIGRLDHKVYEGVIRNAELTLPNFHYIGPIEPTNVNDALAKSVALVHTCEPEGFGNIFIQAWFASCPTLTLEFDPEGLIMRHKTGFVSGSISRMASDLESLILSGELRQQMGATGKALAESMFTAERMVQEIDVFLTDVVSHYSSK